MWKKYFQTSKEKQRREEAWGISNKEFLFSDDNNEEGFGSFLDDFAVNAFLPQIEEKVMQLIQHATAGKQNLWFNRLIFLIFFFVGLDSFQDVRDYKIYSRYPIAKVCLMLKTFIF